MQKVKSYLTLSQLAKILKRNVKGRVIHFSNQCQRRTSNKKLKGICKSSLNLLQNFMTINHEFFHDFLRTIDFKLIIPRESLSSLFVHWQKQH